MVADCIVKEYKLYGRETDSIARDMQLLANNGYKVEVHYSAGNIGGVLLAAVKEAEEKQETKKPVKRAKKETVTE